MLDLTNPADVEVALSYLTPKERGEFDKLMATDPAIWRPQVGRQMEALQSDADIIGYGGAAGGGKSDLIAGLALTEHQRTLVLRREKTQTEGIIQRLTEILGRTDGYNSQKSQWRVGGRLIEFGGLDNPNDHQKWQGRPHDLKALDEVTEMREFQARFVMGWSRTSVPGQRVRNLLTFNPPTTSEGRWVISYFAPWLDDKHSNPAKPGELRWFTTINGSDMEVAGPQPFVLYRGEPITDFDPCEFSAEKVITPKSRTFIPSRVTDNYFYMKTGYIDTLQSMPEPLRSQMLDGDFKAGIEDDVYQVIPTAWIDAAMQRWSARIAKEPMDSIGVDVARGGRDATVISRRHGEWFDELLSYPGSETPDGPTVAGYVISARRNAAPVQIDVVGVGSSPFDFLSGNGIQTEAINGASAAFGVASEGGLKFVNRRAELWWRMREALNPLNPKPVSLPDDSALRADLAAPKWKFGAAGIQVESKDDVKKRIGRSPDKGDAVCYALVATVKREDFDAMLLRVRPYDRYAEFRS